MSEFVLRQFDSQVVLVVGGAPGIRKAIAVCMARERMLLLVDGRQLA